MGFIERGYREKIQVNIELAHESSYGPWLMCLHLSPVIGVQPLTRIIN